MNIMKPKKEKLRLPDSGKPMEKDGKLVPALPPFKLIIAGGRDFRDYNLLCDKCDRLLAHKRNTHNIVIVSGTARGADQLGERYAVEKGYPILRYPANWDRDGNAAGPIRNKHMAESADALVAFWNGKSRGTANMIALARKRNIQIRIVNY